MSYPDVVFQFVNGRVIYNLERVLFSTKDNRTVAKLDELWSMDMFADGETDTKVLCHQINTICSKSLWNELMYQYHILHSSLS